MRSAGRLTSLDAVRGIAASVVVAGHCYFAMPDPWRGRIENAPWSIVLQPLHNGDAAVVVFFVLSGCVLSLPYFRERQSDYRSYLIRRLCRIYIPFAISVLLALLLYSMAGRHPVHEASDWFNTLWPATFPNVESVAGHFLMFGTAPALTLNPPMWSLVYEMRISLVFPLLIALCSQSRVAILMSALLLVSSFGALTLLGENNHPAQAASILATLFWTTEIAVYFVAGILLAKHREQLGAAWRRIPGALRLLFAAGVFLIFAIPPSFARFSNDILYLVGAAVVIVAATESDGLRRSLDRPLSQWLGRISYSLYLTHLPVMLAIFPVTVGKMTFWPAIMAAVAVAFAVAALMHRFVEVPAIALGRLLTRDAWTAAIVTSDA